MAASLVSELTKLVAEAKTLVAEMKTLTVASKAAPSAKTTKAKKDKGDAEAKAPRDATPSFMARNAYGKLLRLQHADRYASDKTEGIKHLTTQKNLIDEDKPAFEAFCTAFVEAIGSSGIPASRWKKDDEEFMTWESEFIKTSLAPSTTPKASPKAVQKPSAPAKPAAPKPAHVVAAAAAAAAAPPKKVLQAGKKAVKTVAKPTHTDASLARITIDGDDYLRDTTTNALWRVDEDGVQGAFTGYYQAGNADPIRYCDHPEDE